MMYCVHTPHIFHSQCTHLRTQSMNRMTLVGKKTGGKADFFLGPWWVFWGEVIMWGMYLVFRSTMLIQWFQWNAFWFVFLRIGGGSNFHPWRLFLLHDVVHQSGFPFLCLKHIFLLSYPSQQSLDVVRSVHCLASDRFSGAVLHPRARSGSISGDRGCFHFVVEINNLTLLEYNLCRMTGEIMVRKPKRSHYCSPSSSVFSLRHSEEPLSDRQ